MNRIAKFANSPFGLLVSGAVLSGLLVQFIVSRWQQNDWLFQQRFIAQRLQMEKQVELQYRTLEDINTEVSTVLAHSQHVVAGARKPISQVQRNQLIAAYNEAVLKWDSRLTLHALRIKTLFKDSELVGLWSAIQKERENLDLAIYDVTTTGGNAIERSLKSIDSIVQSTERLSQRMLAEINATQPK